MQVRILVPVKLLLNPNPDLGVTDLKKKIVLNKFVLNVILMANLDKIQNNEKLFYFSLIFLAFVLPTPGVFISRTGFNSVFPLLDPCPCPPCRSGYRRSPVMRTRIRNTVFDKYFLTVLLTICLVVVFCAEATWRAL